MVFIPIFTFGGFQRIELRRGKNRMQKNLQEIIGRVISGDQEAFREVVEHYQHQAFSLAFRILGDEEEAKDAVQDGFIKLWQHVEKYNPDNKFSSWMYKIMANSAIDRIRKIRRLQEVSLEAFSDKFEKICAGEPDVTMDNKEIARMIGMLADGLPRKQRLVFILRDIQGMDSAEVQNILGLSENNVKSNLHHARKLIREKIDRIFLLERRSV